MKHSIALLSACSLFSIASTAAAGELASVGRSIGADGYEAVPATLFIPDASIPLTPSDECSFPQGGNDNAALGCIGGLEAATDYTPPGNATDVFDGVVTALAMYNVRVTAVRPPDYVPYMMLLPGDAVNPDSLSRTCAGAIPDCDGVQRNDIGTTSGGSMFCMDPDPIQAALIAFGSMSGLEGNDNPMDPMFYQAAAPFGPDYANPSLEYQDMCSQLVPTVDDMEMANQINCAPSLYHEPYCDGQDNQTNGHVELLAIYGAGPVVEDTTPPTIDAIGIEDGMVLPAGADLPLTATVTDDSGLVFARWTITNTSKAFLDFDTNADGVVCKSHNTVCEVDFVGSGPPYYQVDGGDYGAAELAPAGAIGGEFTITFEASDLAGNVMEMVTAVITVEGGTADTSGGSADSADSADSNDSGNDESSSSESGGGGSADAGADGGTDDGGCSCNTSNDAGGAAFMLIGLIGLGWSRRRARA